MMTTAVSSSARAGNGGQALASGYKIRITNIRGVMPDVQFFRRDNPHVRGHEKGLAEGRPDLVVEIISRSSRRYDRVTKLGWHASREVPTRSRPPSPRTRRSSRRRSQVCRSLSASCGAFPDRAGMRARIVAAIA
jgi:hypothetical protein